MKKLLLVLAVAGVFAACNGSSSGDAEKKDSTTQTMSTTPTTDTTQHATDTSAAKMSADTTKKQ